nr:MAG TPA: hypothetical protein [Caudoviricetes sp.]
MYLFLHIIALILPIVDNGRLYYKFDDKNSLFCK